MSASPRPLNMGAGAPSASPLSGRAGSDVEPELDDVTVAHDVVLALDPGFAGRSRGGYRARRHEVIKRHDLGLDEAALEVRVDDPRRLRGGSTERDRPRARLLRASGQ